jgi:hypothetical protein
MAIKRTQETPWMVVNVMTNEVVGYYADDIQAYDAHSGEPVSVQYRPLRKRKKGRSFP